MALRRAEKELERYRMDDSDKDRAMAALQIECNRKIQDAEELGYARGLRDGRELEDLTQ